MSIDTVVKTKKPKWLKVKLPTGDAYKKVRNLVSEHKLNTICESGNCPNMGECWGAGTATFMILGNVCTRSCGFCAVATGKPEKVDVFLDGSLIGKTPISGQKILSGDHIFEIRKDGFAPISYELNVNPSKSVNLDFFMNPVYNVKFKTDEVGLIFELNDDHRWTEDAIRMQLEAGDHQLRVYKLGEIVDEQIIVADQPLTFQYYLKRGVVIKP